MKISSSVTVMITRNVAIGLVLLSLVGQCYGDEASYLQKGYYNNGRCMKRGRGFFGFLRREPVDVERTVTDIIRMKFAADETIAPALLRMQFHDCFVQGCDASILLDGEKSEKTARPNQSVREFELIDFIKAELESLCPQVVSCADIIAMATRDAVYFASSEYPKLRYPPKSFDVQTGRKDGFESLASNVVDLPRPTASVPDSLAAFAKKGLSPEDFTYLLGGGHSVGVTHCGVIQDRLFNFNNTGKSDPNMNEKLKQGLIKYCDNPNKTISLDQGTPNTVDASLYEQVKRYKTGILRADQELASNEETRPIVEAILRGSYRTFNANFWRAMVNLQAVGVKGSRGEVRRHCRAVNGVL